MHPFKGLNLALPSNITSGVAYTTLLSANIARKELEPTDKTVVVDLEAKTVATIVMTY